MASSPRITLSIRFRSWLTGNVGRCTTRYPSAARSATSTRATPMCSPSFAATSATDTVSSHSRTISRYSKESRPYAVAPRSVVSTWDSISRLWSTGSARPDVSRYGRSPESALSLAVPAASPSCPRPAARNALVWLSAGASKPSGSGVIAWSAPQRELEFLDQARGEHGAGPVGEQRHLERDGTQARLLGRQHAEQRADADGAHQQVPLVQFDDHLVRLAERVAVGDTVREAEHRRADRGEPVGVGAFEFGRRRGRARRARRARRAAALRVPGVAGRAVSAPRCPR